MTDPVDIMIEVLNLRASGGPHWHVYRKPLDCGHYLVESHASVAEAVRRAIWLSERDTDEYYVYDPRISDVVFRARQFQLLDTGDTLGAHGVSCLRA